MKSGSEPTPGPPGPAVVATELSVKYRKSGFRWGLQGFSANFHAGITGLVGPNGAGKTTLLRTLAGCVEPTSGRVTIDGASPDAFISRGGLGFLPESPPLPGHLTPREFLLGLPGSDPGNPTRGGVDRFPSPIQKDLLCRPIDSLSLGQRKTVALAAALSGGPHLLLLDEPTNGLDPIALSHLRKTLLTQRALGAVLIVSSHQLDELQRVADRLVFVRDGRSVGSWQRDAAIEEFGSLEELFSHVFRMELHDQRV